MIEAAAATALSGSVGSVSSRGRASGAMASSAAVGGCLGSRSVCSFAWSSASRAWLGSVGCAILSDSLRPALGDQLVDQVAIASNVSEHATQLGCGAPSCSRRVGRVRRPGHGLIVTGGGPANQRFADAACGDPLRALASRREGSRQAPHPGWPLAGPGASRSAASAELRVGRVGPSGPSGCARAVARAPENLVANRSLACLTAMQQLGVPRRAPASCAGNG